MPEGTVLVRLRALGDVVLLGAITASLPGPVTIVTEPRYVPLARRLIGVDRAVPLGTAVTGRVIDLQRDLKTLRAYPLARKLRKHSLSRWRMLRGLGGGRPPVPELYAKAAQTTARPPPWVALPERERDMLVLVPGAAFAPKRWSPAGFSAVGRGWPGPVAVLGGPGEQALCEEVAQGVPQASVLCEEGFDQTLDLLSRARVAVAADTGLMHLAAAAGARVVALFGPTSERDGFFPYTDGRSVSLALPCRPCARHRVTACAAGHHGCMGQDVDSVLQAVRACAG